MFKTIFSKLVALFTCILLVSFIITGVMMFKLLGDYTSLQKQMVLKNTGQEINTLMQSWVQLANENRYNPVLLEVVEKSVKRNLQFYSYYTNSIIRIVDSDGWVVYAFSPSGEMTSLESKQLEEKEYKHVLDSGKTRSYIWMSPFEKNVPYLTFEMPLVSEGNKIIGVIFLHTPVPEMEQVTSDVFKFFIQAAIISFIVALILMYLFSRRITKPIKEITAASKEIASGEFQKKIEINSKDEIGELADSFNSMTESLKNLEEMRRSFIANVSHELRTPMTSIQGFIEGILDGTIPPERHKQYLSIVKEETDRLNRLVNDLLDLAKMEAGETVLKICPFDINELIRRTVIKFENQITEKNIEVEAHFEEEYAIAEADPDSIERVLINLLHNAIKFTGGEGKQGKIIITTRKMWDKIYVSIKDNGIGMSPEELKHIWERFYKSDKSRGKDRTGTGLGLSIVRNIIQEHRQEIRVESELGKGTKFTFTLQAGRQTIPPDSGSYGTGSDAAGI